MPGSLRPCLRGQLPLRSGRLVGGGSQFEVLRRETARVVRGQSQPDPVGTNIDIRMVTGLFSQIGYPVDEAQRGKEIRKLEGTHQLTALHLPCREGGQVRSDFRWRECWHRFYVGGKGVWAMSKVENRLFWLVISARSSCHSSVGIFRKTSTTAGSNWVPEQRRISSRAASKLRPLR